MNRNLWQNDGRFYSSDRGNNKWNRIKSNDGVLRYARENRCQIGGNRDRRIRATYRTFRFSDSARRNQPRKLLVTSTHDFPKSSETRHAGSRNKYLVVSFAARTRARRAGKRGQGILSERTSLAVWGLRGWRLNPKSILRLTLLA